MKIQSLSLSLRRMGPGFCTEIENPMGTLMRPRLSGGDLILDILVLLQYLGGQATILRPGGPYPETRAYSQSRLSKRWVD